MPSRNSQVGDRVDEPVAVRSHERLKATESRRRIVSPARRCRMHAHRPLSGQRARDGWEYDRYARHLADERFHAKYARKKAVQLLPRITAIGAAMHPAGRSTEILCLPGTGRPHTSQHGCPSPFLPQAPAAGDPRPTPIRAPIHGHRPTDRQPILITFQRGYAHTVPRNGSATTGKPKSVGRPQASACHEFPASVERYIP